jgi:hypothetical protein
MIPQGNGSWMHSPATTVDVKPGGVTQVTIGGSGRTVIGKVRLSDSNAEVNWQHAHASLHLPFPEAFLKPDKAGDQSAWLQSAAGKAFLKNNRAYAFKVAADGSFHAEEVLPGKYELDIMLMASAEPAMNPSDFIGRFHQEVVVPETSNKADDTPADLGTLEGKLESMPK